MKIKRVIHIGILAKRMEPVRALYRDVLNLELSHEEVYEGDVDINFFPVGATSVEIIGDNPRSGNGRIAEIIQNQGGEGLHHIAFEVEDLDSALKELSLKKISIREGDPRSGAHGTRIAFLDSSVTHGVEIELVECKC